MDHHETEQTKTNETDPTNTDDMFNKKLHIKLTWEPDPMHPDVELVLETFETTIRKAFHKSQQKLHDHNLDPDHMAPLKQTKKDNHWSILNTDKGLGPATIETKNFSRSLMKNISATQPIIKNLLKKTLNKSTCQLSIEHAN